MGAIVLHDAEQEDQDMRDYTQEELEETRPHPDTLDCINHCLRSFYRDTEHSVTDVISPYLTYEEVIGALLLARDSLEYGGEQYGYTLYS